MPTKKQTAKKADSVVMWVPPERRRSSRSGKIKRVRNPWTPDDIIILVKFVCTYGAGRYLYRIIRLWMEDRKARKIEIKIGENELRIEGGISDKSLEKKFEQFRKLIKGVTYDEIKVAIPKGARRTIPARLTNKKAETERD